MSRLAREAQRERFEDTPLAASWQFPQLDFYQEADDLVHALKSLGLQEEVVFYRSDSWTALKLRAMFFEELAHRFSLLNELLLRQIPQLVKGFAGA